MTGTGEGDRNADEAAEWFARLNQRSVSREELEEFYAWRREPGNAEAYERVERLWRDARALGGDREIAESVREALERPRRSFLGRGKRPLIALAAAAAVGAALLALQLQQPRTYETAVGEQRLVTLDDGSRVRLNTDSLVRVDYSESARELELARGEAFFDVKHDPGRPFVVEVDGLAVRALGTRFDVRRTGPIRVILVEGSVSVSADDDASAPSILSPGEAITIAAGGERSVSQVDLESATSWTAGRMIFKETPLAEAVAEANRYSERKIKLRSARHSDLRVDGTFETGDVEAFAMAMTALFPLRAETEEDGSIVLTPTSG